MRPELTPDFLARHVLQATFVIRCLFFSNIKLDSVPEGFGGLSCFELPGSEVDLSAGNSGLKPLGSLSIAASGAGRMRRRMLRSFGFDEIVGMT